jgi:hypothetical protein
MDNESESEIADPIDDLEDELEPYDLVDEDKLQPEDVSGIVSYTLDWSVQSLLERIGKTFDLNPSFQRRDAWSGSRKSAYIESLMLGLPVPQIVLAEDQTRKGQFIVLDGKQRLITMKQFAAPDSQFKAIRLRRLEFLKELNGKSADQLRKSPDATEWLESLLAQPVRTIVVRNWGKPAVLYQIFVRLNQNSVSLSPQELRQALFPGGFTVWINNRSAESLAIRRARRLKGPDFRMRDAEMLLRFVAFHRRLEDYAGNLREFLDEECRIGNLEWGKSSSEFEAIANTCEEAIDRTMLVFGGDTSFLRYEQDGYIRRFNVAVFDLMTAIYSSPELTREVIEENATAFRMEFERLCVEDHTFQDSIKSTTKTPEATATRIIRYAEAIETVTGLELQIKQRARALWPEA